MPGGVRATRTAVHVSPAAEKRYAMLFLPAVLQGTPAKQELLLPLTLAYLLSRHIAFRFPLHTSAMPVVERVFDGILEGLPKESKGICYQTVEDAEPALLSVPRASLLVTDDCGLQALPGCERLPAAVLSSSEGNRHFVRLQNLEHVSDGGLRAKLLSCAQLVNSQSDGFITEGHFSLSW
jgi:hypothetical protein